MASMKTLMESWRKKSAELLSETTFTRIAQKVRDERIPFVVMSADRHEYSGKENKRRYQSLKSDVKSGGYPFAEVQGSWAEKDEEGNEIRVVESSVIIYDEERPDVPRTAPDLFELARTLSKTYEQEAFIFGEPGSRSGIMHINAYSPEGTTLDYGGPWTDVEKIPDDAPFWSRVRGSTFVFKESLDSEEVIQVDAPNSVIDAMRKARQHRGKKIEFIRRKKE
tara:strand:- start:844 stop:1512 length:669 start_codon:yes stop_codon:yes gene_type:complete